jgi:hypothetical protein
MFHMYEPCRNVPVIHLPLLWPPAFAREADAGLPWCRRLFFGCAAFSASFSLSTGSKILSARSGRKVCVSERLDLTGWISVRIRRMKVGRKYFEAVLQRSKLVNLMVTIGIVRGSQASEEAPL